ncbi:hypothetical protein [uncultured Megamonas sp.]|uniref:hypothetical protein n=1 Tax=uncultured Megamonas sp. TaxID=286140 RepID=UPI00259B184C|nr:hypothetical protein [uncultured Megamonas sp.]
MGINLGTTNITKVYLGQQEISKIYQGNNLVYSTGEVENPFKATLVGLANESGYLVPTVENPNFIRWSSLLFNWLGTNDGNPPNCYIRFPFTKGLTYFCYMGASAYQYTCWSFVDENGQLLGVIGNDSGWASFCSNGTNPSSWQQVDSDLKRSDTSNATMALDSHAEYANVTCLNVDDNKIRANFPYPAKTLSFEFNNPNSYNTQIIYSAKYIYLSINFNGTGAPENYPVDMIGILDTRDMTWTQSNFRKIAVPENNKIEW